MPENRVRQASHIRLLELEVDALAHDLRIAEEARANGAAGLPPPEQTYADGPEQKIRQEIVRRVEDAKAQALNEEKALRTAVNSRQLAPAVMRSDQLPEDAEREFAAEARRLENEAEELSAILRGLRGEIERYQNQYGIERAPQLKAKEDRNVALAALVLFSLLQLASNAVLFAGGSALGLAFGLFIALVFAAFDIGLHFTLGQWAARINAPDVLNRMAGAGAGAVAAATALGLNLGAVHLRRVSIDATTSGGIADWNDWLPGLLANPFGLSDPLSWLLFGVGMLCSLLALGSGWLWDEPIPLFRRKQRLVLRHMEDLQDIEDERSRLVTDVVGQYEAKLDALDREAEAHVSIIADSVGRIRQLCADFQGYCVSARETYVALVSRYRDENWRHRDGRTVPDYFKHAPVIEIDTRLPVSLPDLDELEARERQRYDELKEALRNSRARLRSLGRPGVGGEDDGAAT